MYTMTWCVECVEWGDAARGGGVVESRSVVGVVSRENLLREDVHSVYVSVRYRKQVVMWKSICVRMVLYRGSGVQTERLGVCSVGVQRCELDGVAVRGESCCVGDGGR